MQPFPKIKNFAFYRNSMEETPRFVHTGYAREFQCLYTTIRVVNSFSENSQYL